MASANDYNALMANRPMPFYLNSETPDAAPGGVLPYQTQAEADPYLQAAESGKTLMQSVVDEISGQAEINRKLARAKLLMESGTITQGNAMDFNQVAKGTLEGLGELSGVAPSGRVVDRLTKLQSPVLRPDSAFGWGRY